MFGFSRTYSLRKAQHILHHVNRKYRKQWKSLTDNQLREVEGLLSRLDAAIESKDRSEADRLARLAETFAMDHFPTKWWMGALTELPVAIVIALLVAVVVRQMWFELYQIPTGSMRPSFKEQDHLIVSKTTFGVNVPLAPEHFYFNPDLVQRLGVVVFTAENLDTPDPDTTYFWLFNAKKRFIKRMIGKPGDSLYFYGGKIYAVDANGSELRELLTSPWLERLEHIPFNRFEGRRFERRAGEYIFAHMHEPIGRLSYDEQRGWMGEVRSGDRWTVEKPLSVRSPESQPLAFGDFYGIKNFAMGRLLSASEVKRYTDHDLGAMEKGQFYLELFHHPGITSPTPRIQSGSRGGVVQGLSSYRTLIPLQQKHVDRLMDGLYTARFVVKGEKAIPYSVSLPQNIARGVPMPGVPDGTYEFYYGRAREIGFMGRPIDLPEDHPIYTRTPDMIQALYNAGIDVMPQVLPSAGQRALIPTRYAYFRGGALYLMGSEVFAADDPILQSFISREAERERYSSNQTPYIAFKDYGPPVREDGSFDVEKIRSFGYTVPDKHYVVLGDNHAMSGDSRHFGPIPEANLRGTPVMVLWPWDERAGAPPQDGYPTITMGRLIVWGIALAIFGIWYAFHRYRARQLAYVKVSV